MPEDHDNRERIRAATVSRAKANAVLAAAICALAGFLCFSENKNTGTVTLAFLMLLNIYKARLTHRAVENDSEATARVEKKVDADIDQGKTIKQLVNGGLDKRIKDGVDAALIETLPKALEPLKREIGELRTAFGGKGTGKILDMDGGGE